MKILRIVGILIIASVSYWFGTVMTKNKLEAQIRQDKILQYVDSAKKIQDHKFEPIWIDSIYVPDKFTGHMCRDTTHRTCDGFCECDGMECWVHKRDYEVDVYMDTLWLWDGSRLVGRYTSDWGNQIDTLIIKDNL